MWLLEMLPFQTLVWAAMVIACGFSFHAKPSQVSPLSLGCSRAEDRTRYWVTWLPTTGTRGSRLCGGGDVWLRPSLPGLQKLPVGTFCAVSGNGSSAEGQGLWNRHLFFIFFPLFWGFFFPLASPSSPHTFPGPLPRTTLVPFSPTKGTKSFFYRPTGCSGYKEVKLTIQRCNSPLQADLDESQK